MSALLLVALLAVTFLLGMSAGCYYALKLVFDWLRLQPAARRTILKQLGPWRRVFE